MSRSAAHFDKWCARVSLGVMESIHGAALRRARQFEQETGHVVSVIYPAVAPATGVGHIAHEMQFMCVTLEGVEVHLFSARNPGKPPTIHLLTPAEQLNPHALFSRDPRPAEVPKSSPRASASAMPKSSPRAAAPSSDQRSRNAGTALMKGPARPHAVEPLTQTAPMSAEEQGQPVSSQNPYGLAAPPSSSAPLTQTARMNVPHVNEPRVIERTHEPARRAQAVEELGPIGLARPARAPTALAAEMSRPPASMRELARHRVQTIALCQVIPTEDGGFVLFKARSTEERAKLDDVVFRVFEELVNRWRRLGGG